MKRSQITGLFQMVVVAVIFLLVAPQVVRISTDEAFLRMNFYIFPPSTWLLLWCGICSIIFFVGLGRLVIPFIMTDDQFFAGLREILFWIKRNILRKEEMVSLLHLLQVRKANGCTFIPNPDAFLVPAVLAEKFAYLKEKGIYLLFSGSHTNYDMIVYLRRAGFDSDYGTVETYERVNDRLREKRDWARVVCQKAVSLAENPLTFGLYY